MEVIKAAALTDPIVDSVVKQFRKRSKIGIEKYGTTLEQNNNDDFLQHLKEELMDAVLYIEKLQSLKRASIVDRIKECLGQQECQKYRENNEFLKADSNEDKY